jgi:hypothetical protein
MWIGEHLGRQIGNYRPHSQFTIFGDEPLAMMAKQEHFIPLLGLPSLVASIFITFGIIDVYLLQGEKAGIFSLIAFLIAFIGLTLSISVNWRYVFVSPILAKNSPFFLEGDPAGQGLITAILLSYLAAQIGLLILGISMLMTRIFPKWVSLTLIGSIVAVGLLSPIADTKVLRFLYNALIGLGPIVIGFFLHRNLNDNGLVKKVTRSTRKESVNEDNLDG